MNLTYTSWIVTAILIGFLYFLKKKKISFGIRVLIAMALGVAVGIIFGNQAQSIGVLGSIYINLIMMLVIPLVISSIISSMTSLTDIKQLKTVGVKTIGLFLLLTAIASVIGILVGLVFDPGSGISIADTSGYKVREVNFTAFLLDMIPKNPVAEMSAGKIIPVIIFAMIIGVAITIESERKPETMKPVKDVVNSFTQVMFRVTKMVLKLTPYGVFGLLTAMASKYGLGTLLELGKFILAVYVACILHTVITYTGFVGLAAKVNPLRFFRKIFPVMVVGFTTRSSYSTLPVTMKTLTERVKISERIVSFVAPLGATINMNGCGGLYPAIVCIFIAKVYGIDLTFTSYLLIVLTSVLASVGTAGVPGTASIMATVVLSSAGLPVAGIALVMGIDAIVDMARTAVNVTGTTVAALIVGESEGEFDREAFNREDDTLQLNPS
ncbi:dicarboxylate/amino acid:cation symporter [Paenibacillus larvae]|uniref:DAACS family dicarboxylate/amino acid:cation symporter n=4 Tax=Paenibacillus larvae TaxID=1464 RepID=V9WAZ3_9BACL|nr:dicarboxylate/amino acid:cation symporter [Paenibacillus larvae]AHD06885.1 DAACS family dicarboxylate/amino acid:cation symporter [Paenibacillus larvae subsp. larvae DSM 25430]AQR76284.1 dicarboxylate/amino acid:cation symporter [Paenibacillus larvae subsp. larvae]AVF22925.1 DAACS family dicarboxylate/amino acid:cation symporter [Paenibacillus larvae subsp. larvae]AVG13449.1 DAACS family dicarboxylate/amino acid:cation symporter [Paenibacillus larvae subsp. larvae DSM 25430]ETK26419.1 DAACS